MKSRPAWVAIALAGLVLGVTACGRHGDLDTPSAAAAQARGEEVPAETAPPERGFILDALIE